MDNDGDVVAILSYPRDNYTCTGSALAVHWQENVVREAGQCQDQRINHLTSIHNQEFVNFDGDDDLDLLISCRVESDSRLGRIYVFESTSGDGRSWDYYEVKDFLSDHTNSRAGDVIE